MSPRAAWRLERLGFTEVHDYVAGEADWLAFWLPWDGHALLAGEAMRAQVPTCGILDHLGDVRDRLAEGPGFLVVLNDDGVVMGVLPERAAKGAADATVEDVMVIGPTTIRPSEPLEALTGRMADRDVDALPVTSSDGRLLGLLVRHEAEALLDGRERT